MKCGSCCGGESVLDDLVGELFKPGVEFVDEVRLTYKIGERFDGAGYGFGVYLETFGGFVSGSSGVVTRFVE